MKFGNLKNGEGVEKDEKDFDATEKTITPDITPDDSDELSLGDNDESVNLEDGEDEQLPPDLDEYFKELSEEEIQQIRDSERDKLYIVVDGDTHYIRAFIPELDNEDEIKEKGGYIMTQDRFLQLYDDSEVVENEEIKEHLARTLSSMIKEDNQKAFSHFSNYINEKSAQILRRKFVK